MFMEGNELDEIRKKQLQERVKAAYIEEKKREVMRRFLEGPAYERVMNIKTVNPDLYDKLVELVVQLVGSGRLNRKLSDNELVTILSKLSERREPSIHIRRK